MTGHLRATRRTTGPPLLSRVRGAVPRDKPRGADAGLVVVPGISVSRPQGAAGAKRKPRGRSLPVLTIRVARPTQPRSGRLHLGGVGDDVGPQAERLAALALVELVVLPPARQPLRA